ncbi:MAG: hypothetical protein QM696_12120 [Steroidobacteraceae bacterium]
METRDDLLGELELHVARIAASVDLAAQLRDVLQRAEAQELEIAPHQRNGDDQRLPSGR